MKKILIATHNKNKRRELQNLLKGFKGIKIQSLSDLAVAPPVIIEDGKTFRQNSVKKSVITSKFYNGLVLADDSGLEVDILGGKPGVRSARFARKNATDPENNKKLLKLLEKVPKKDRGAQFVCCLTLAEKGSLIDSFEGVVRGKIRVSPKGSNGFGYDPLFAPEGKDKTFAEMTPSYKNRISHRALALKEFKVYLKKYLKDKK